VNIVLLASPKGGVGKTFLAANLAALLASRAAPHSVALLDLDPQDSARLHFGRLAGTRDGWASRLARKEDPAQSFVATSGGVLLVPHGEVTSPVPDRPDAVPDDCAKELTPGEPPSRRLGPVLDALAARGVATLICDSRPGRDETVEMVLSRTSLLLTVLLADPASAALLPECEKGWHLGPRVPRDLLGGRRSGYVLNQVDWSFALSERIARGIAERLGDRLVGAICRDVAVMAGLAHASPVAEFAPASEAARDLRAFADAVEQRLASAGTEEVVAEELPPLLRGILS